MERKLDKGDHKGRRDKNPKGCCPSWGQAVLQALRRVRVLRSSNKSLVEAQAGVMREGHAGQKKAADNRMDAVRAVRDIRAVLRPDKQAGRIHIWGHCR